MKKKKVIKKSNLILIIILLIVLVSITLIAYTFNFEKLTPQEKIGKCIGENSVLYIQTGCGACHTQLDRIKEINKFLKIIDCKENNWQLCLDEEIRATPTWKINGESVIGVKTIEQLQELTGC